MVIKHLPAQPHLSTTQNQDLPLEKSKGHSQAEKENLFSENTGSAMLGLPDTSFSNSASVWTDETPGDFDLFGLGCGLRCCVFVSSPDAAVTLGSHLQVEVRQVGHYSVCVFGG